MRVLMCIIKIVKCALHWIVVCACNTSTKAQEGYSSKYYSAYIHLTHNWHEIAKHNCECGMSAILVVHRCSYLFLANVLTIFVF